MKRTCPVCASATKEIARIPFIWIQKRYERSYGIKIIPLCEKDADYIYSKCETCGIGFFSNAPEGDGKFYKALQQNPWYYRKGKWEYKEIANLVKVGDNVLDVGCGIGEFADCITAGALFTGLEINAEAAETAARYGRRVLIQSVDAHAIDNCNIYDIVCSFQVMEHVSEPLPLLRSMYRLVKPGGFLVIAVPNNDSYIGSHPNAILNMPPHHMLRWNESSLRKAGSLLGVDSDIKFKYEPMDDAHKKDYLSYVAINLIHKYGDECEKVFNSSFAYKLKSKLLSRFLNLNKVKDDICANAYPIGHTIIAVMRKPN